MQFTEREDATLNYLMEGCENSLIAKELNVSLRAVKKYVKGLMVKTGCKSRSELVVKVAEERKQYAEPEVQRRWLITLKHLTAKEKQITWLAARGMRTKEMADQLGITVQSTKNRLQSVYEKTGFSSRLQLASSFVVMPSVMENLKAAAASA